MCNKHILYPREYKKLSTGPKTFRRAIMHTFTYIKKVFPSIKVLNMEFHFSFTMSAEECYYTSECDN